MSIRIIEDPTLESMRVHQLYLSITHFATGVGKMIEKWQEKYNENPFVSVKLSKYKKPEEMAKIRHLQMETDPQLEKGLTTEDDTNRIILDEVDNELDIPSPEKVTTVPKLLEKKKKIITQDANNGTIKPRISMTREEIAKHEYAVRFEKPTFVGYCSDNSYDVLMVDELMGEEVKESLLGKIKEKDKEIITLKKSLEKANNIIVDLREQVQNSRPISGNARMKLNDLLEDVSFMARQSNIESLKEKIKKSKNAISDLENKKQEHRKKKDSEVFILSFKRRFKTLEIETKGEPVDPNFRIRYLSPRRSWDPDVNIRELMGEKKTIPDPDIEEPIIVPPITFKTTTSNIVKSTDTITNRAWSDRTIEDDEYRTIMDYMDDLCDDEKDNNKKRTRPISPIRILDDSENERTHIRLHSDDDDDPEFLYDYDVDD